MSRRATSRVRSSSRSEVRRQAWRVPQGCAGLPPLNGSTCNVGFGREGG
jgi:hypothetical protein